MKGVISRTYWLQTGAVFLMIFAIWVGALAARHGDRFIALLDAVLFAINFAVFIWQGRIRSAASAAREQRE